MKKVPFLVFLMIAVALPSGVVAKDKGELVISSWGGIFEKAQRKAHFDPFEKETGIKVIAVTQPSISKVKAMVESGNVEWDIVYIAGGIFMPLLKQGLLEKIDYSYFDQTTLDQLYEEAKRPFAVGSFYFSVVMAYSTETFPGDSYPKSWAEFWDVKKFPGPRTLTDMSTDGGGWEFALLADGVPKDKLYDNPDIERAFKKLTEIKPHVAKWWRQGQQPPQMLIDKEIVAGSAYNGRIERVKQQGAPVAYHWNGGKLYLEYVCIPKGAPNYENAMKFIAWHTRADKQAAFARAYTNGPVNAKAFDELPDDIKRRAPSYPPNKEKQFFINQDWFADNAERVVERWNKWILEK
jgi:putative spermidine/putrescine transport system substrate-binding protein